MFLLNSEEVTFLRSQFVTSNLEVQNLHLKKWS
jgi:hypothetical protein